MKKVIYVIIAVVASVLLTSNVSAATNQKLLNYARENVSSSELVQVKRFLKQNNVTDKQADKIISIGNEIKGILEANNVESYKDLSKLTKSQKNNLLDLATEAANVVGAKLTYDGKNKKIFIEDANGNIYDVDLKAELNNTDSNNIVLLSSVAFVGVATTILLRKKHNA